MSKEYKKSEQQQLKEELLRFKKENKRLSEKLDQSKYAIKDLKKELKKNDTQKKVLYEKQKQFQSSVLNDMNIQNLLSD